ncbi:hypothetical protein [Holdemanella biformis]
MNKKNSEMNFVFSLDDINIILTDEKVDDACTSNVTIHIDNKLKQYDCMGYTTDIDTMRLIFQNKTIRSTSLANPRLNDENEKERLGVTEFAPGYFVTCFTHTNQENSYFWNNYGKDVKENKVLLQFKNFALNFKDCINTNFARVKNNKICFFNSREYEGAVNNRKEFEESRYDIGSCINTVEVFDVVYKSKKSKEITQNYSGKADLHLDKITGENNSVKDVNIYDPTVFGKYKTDDWAIEQETRILSSLLYTKFDKWKYIDLNLYDEFFRGLTIVLSPWDKGSLKEEVEDILNNSNLPSDILNSISIRDSVYKNKLE